MNFFFRNPFEGRGKSYATGLRLKARRIYSYPAIILLACACSSAPVKEINTDINKNNIKIRYVNISILFDYMISRDPDAVEVKNKREEILASIDDIRKKIDGLEEEWKQGLLKDLKEKQGSLLKLKNDEDYYKSRILNEIDGAIESIAKKDDIDFVLNIGEGAVYARKEYDITEKVLQEIEGRAKRNAPVSR